MFDYQWVITGTEREYLAVLDKYAEQYEAYCRKTKRDPVKARSFQGWWMLKGPTAFKTPEQAGRFRRELMLRIVWRQTHADAVANVG